MRHGKKPALSARRVESIDPNVYELKEGDEKTWYRAVYLSKIDDVIYVLHSNYRTSRSRSLNT